MELSSSRLKAVELYRDRAITLLRALAGQSSRSTTSGSRTRRRWSSGGKTTRG
jgi:hypothetical protein